MNLYTKLSGRKKYKIEGENLKTLQTIAFNINDLKSSAQEIEKIKEFIYFNKQNPYIHQYCANYYFSLDDRANARKYLDKALEMNIKDGGWSHYTNALNEMFPNFVSYNAISSLKELIENKADYETQHHGDPVYGIFMKMNIFEIPTFHIDLRHNKTLANIYFLLSTCNYHFNLTYEAKEYVIKAIELNPDKANYHTFKEELFRT